MLMRDADDTHFRQSLEQTSGVVTPARCAKMAAVMSQPACRLWFVSDGLGVGGEHAIPQSCWITVFAEQMQ